MICPKSVRTAAIVSQVFIIVWTLLSLLASIFQNSFAGLYISRYYIENIDKIAPVVTIINCVKGLLLSAANVLMCRGKNVYAPLIMTAVTMGIFPVITNVAKMIRFDYYSAFGSGILAKCNAVNTVELMLSNILAVAAIITVAAAAVYAYAKKNQNAGNDIPAEIKKENDLL